MPSQDPGLQTAASVEQAISGNAAVAKAMLAAVQELVACQASLLEIVEGLTHELDAVASQVALVQNLSERWGVERATHGGTRVWADFSDKDSAGTM